METIASSTGGEIPDHIVIQRVVAGDREVFSVVVHRHEPALRRFVALRVPDPASVADVVQRTFLVLLRNIGAYDPQRPLLAWLRGIARNQCRNEWRAARRQAELKDRLLLVLRADAHLRQLDREESAQDHEDPHLPALRRCLAELSADEQRLVALRFVEAQGLDHVAALVGRSAEAIRLALFRLRQRLRDCIRRRLAREGGQ